MDISKVMTPEQKAEAFDCVVEQRDKCLTILARILDVMHCGHSNGWDVAKHMTIDQQRNNEHPGLMDDRETFIKKLSKLGYYHLCQLEKVFSKIWPEEENIFEHPELYKLLKSFDKNRLTEEEFKTKPPVIKCTDRQFAGWMMRFYLEYKFGHQYPDEENGIYADTFRYMTAAALQRAGIDPSDEGEVAKLITEDN